MSPGLAKRRQRGKEADRGDVTGVSGRASRARATRASWIERKRPNLDKHFAVSGFCTADYTRDLEAVGIPVYEEATHATRAIAALARSGGRDGGPRLPGPLSERM